VREILGLDIGAVESGSFWVEFLRSLKKRGLAGVKLAASDQHEGLKYAIERVLGCCWQRCTVHFVRDMLAHCRRDQRGLVSAALREVFNAEDREQARERATQVISRLEPLAPKVCRLLEEAEEDLIAFYAFPREHWTKLLSTNPLERVNKEIGRRSDVVGIFPNDASAIRLVGALLIEQNDEWLVQRRYLSAESMTLILSAAQTGGRGRRTRFVRPGMTSGIHGRMMHLTGRTGVSSGGRRPAGVALVKRAPPQSGESGSKTLASARNATTVAPSPEGLNWLDRSETFHAIYRAVVRHAPQDCSGWVVGGAGRAHGDQSERWYGLQEQLQLERHAELRGSAVAAARRPEGRGRRRAGRDRGRSRQGHRSGGQGPRTGDADQARHVAGGRFGRVPVLRRGGRAGIEERPGRVRERDAR
jgi:hypothetical protein